MMQLLWFIEKYVYMCNYCQIPTFVDVSLCVEMKYILSPLQESISIHSFCTKKIFHLSGKTHIGMVVEKAPRF